LAEHQIKSLEGEMAAEILPPKIAKIKHMVGCYTLVYFQDVKMFLWFRISCFIWNLEG
jgi:hypothetical protein